MKKQVFIGVVLFIFFSVGGMVLWFSPKKKGSDLHIELLGSQVMTITSLYQEPGYRALDPIDGDLTDKVQVAEQIDYTKKGTYEIIYRVQNSRGETAVISRFVVLEQPLSFVYDSKYDAISNQARSWWSGNKKDHTRPSGGYGIEELQKYGATFLGPDEPVIYLTFDEGSNDTFVNEIVDVLNENQVKATFFLCRGFILDNPDLMKKLVASGHSVGNHTAHHVQMSRYANQENYHLFVKEITDLEEAFYQVTGTRLDKVYREPKGEWSERSLAMIRDLGYKTFFYSADYLDWNGEVSKEYAYQELMKRYHNGAIYLIHPQNKGNYLALDQFIKDMKNLGYRFDLVKNIPFS